MDWYPWGEEALPLLKSKTSLSFSQSVIRPAIGVTLWSASFEDMEVGKLLSKHFICVKVDREERPDIDAVYMTAQQMTGSGGWPMTVIMTQINVRSLPNYFLRRAVLVGQDSNNSYMDSWVLEDDGNRSSRLQRRSPLPRAG